MSVDSAPAIGGASESFSPPSSQSGIGSGSNRGSANPDQRMLVITKAKYRVITALKADEAARSKLTKEDVTDEATVHSYEIRAREDFQTYVNSLIGEEAATGGISRLALKAALAPEMDGFDIPKGMKQMVTIRIPNDPAIPVSYSCVTLPTDPNPGVFSGGGISAGRVKSESKGWRYDNLIIIDTP